MKNTSNFQCLRRSCMFTSCGVTYSFLLGSIHEVGSCPSKSQRYGKATRKSQRCAVQRPVRDGLCLDAVEFCHLSSELQPSVVEHVRGGDEHVPAESHLSPQEGGGIGIEAREWGSR